MLTSVSWNSRGLDWKGEVRDAKRIVSSYALDTRSEGQLAHRFEKGFVERYVQVEKGWIYWFEAHLPSLLEPFRLRNTQSCSVIAV